ncbi:hypothetical protein BZG36_04919 [Bifiguratus adelaidae]|uniref:EF-hand domain-containing protein n=1 Tax=Bifiguratus adelaidae TaxID=1938954 RepID=A0A261XXC8_9FUNG|nr:hypothetical protein BZG36_04919 [Bifiguratus adelaidae]
MTPKALSVRAVRSVTLRGPLLTTRPTAYFISNVHKQQTRSFIPAMVARVASTNLLRYFGLGAVTGTAGVGGYMLFSDPDVEELTLDDIKVPELALHPSKGGMKDLPIVTNNIDDTSDEIDKPRLVIIGGGWGAVSTLKQLNEGQYHITLISPTNYFLFTPLLPSATVGTLDLRSLCEPIRKILKRVAGHYLEATATDIDFDRKLVEVRTKGTDPTDPSSAKSFYVPYDKLVIAVGSTSQTHGVDGLEHTYQLKTILDARAMKRKVLDNFEKASLPTTSPEERKQLLSFVVCGGGPTGVEYAAELFDMISEDLGNVFPKVLRNEVSVTIIQSRDHILNTFEAGISKYVEKRFSREHVNVVTNSRVQHIEPTKVIYDQKRVVVDDNGEKHEITETKEVEFGLCLWSTGIAPTTFSQLVRSKIPEQNNRRALVTDERLRLKGISDSSVYALGDCATIDNPHLVEHIMDLFQEADKDKDGTLTWNEFRDCVSNMVSRYPITENHMTKLKDLFDKYDIDRSGTLDMDEMRQMLSDIDKKMTSLPATAQVADQQGKYLGKKLKSLAMTARPPYTALDDPPLGPERSPVRATLAIAQAHESQYPPFKYTHLGSLAYVGNTAVGEFSGGFKMMGGLWALYLWRSIFLSEQVSLRTRSLIMLDWTKKWLFGRDVSIL